MRMTEIRCTDPVRKAGATGGVDKRILLKRGTTVLYFNAANVGLAPIVSIQSSLFSYNTALSDFDKKKFFQAFYQEGLSSMPDSFERKIAAVAAVPNFSFILTDDVSQRLLQGVAGNDQEKFLLPGAVGAESNLLAQRLNWSTLLDDSVDAVRQRSHILQLKERLEQSRENLTAPGQGKLYRTRSELISVLKDPALEANVSGTDLSGTEEVRQLERHIRSLKEKDKELHEEQRTLMLLSIKNDYESLLRLRLNLEDLESNVSHYARSITGQGRDITVHELTVLSGLYQDYQEKEKTIEIQREEVKKAREERFAWEQKRILAEHKAKQLQDKVTEFEAEQLERIQDRRELQDSTTSTKGSSPSDERTRLRHILLLAGLTLTFVGLLLFNRSRTISIIAFVLAGIGLASSFLLFIRSRLARQTHNKVGLVDNLRSPSRPVESSSLNQRLSEQKSIWRSASAEAEQWAAAVNRGQIALHSLEENQRRAANELLRQLSRYAAVENLDDAGYVLDALRNQRQSATSYDESVSELLRQIANVRKGRTDEDMLREYEHACEELYGDLLAGDDSGNKHIDPRSQTLHYDKNRAKRIEIERVELSQDLSRLQQQLQETITSLQQKEKILSRTPELRRKREFLEQNLWQEIDDLEQLDLAISVLEYLNIQWREIPVNFLRSLTLKYSRRLQGVKPMGLDFDDFMIEKQRGIRRGELDKFKSMKTREKELTLIDNSPSDIVYLAFRMALLDSGKDNFTPLLIFDLPLLNTSSRVSEFLNLLEERMLELSAQSVFFTSNNLLTEIARERQIPVHQI